MKNFFSLTLFTALAVCRSHALSLDDVQFWTGSGTNRAALVIHWSAPEVRESTSVPNPAAEKSIAWGYRWNGAATGQAMFDAIVAADHRLFVTTSALGQYGKSIYGIGYDLNNNGVFGVRLGTNVLTENVFTNGQYIFDGEDPDAGQALDAGDLFWSGFYGPGWEVWQEQGGAGGFATSPDRGTDRYWTSTDPDYFSTGFHGQWDLSFGLSSIDLKDGSWVGFSVARGGLNFFDETDPGTIAYDHHKQAPLPPEAAVTNSTYAVQVIAAQGPFGPSPYNDTNSVLGAPATSMYESASKPATRVKLVEPAYSFNVSNGVTNKLIITLNTGSSIIARFDHPVYDNPANPYGIDFEVFGNSFYTASGFSSDAVNLNSYQLSGGGFFEPMKVSVSPGYTGQAGQDPNDPTTWSWYRYDNGPYADTDCPTEAYRWNRTNAAWTDELMDFNKPVNPMLKTQLDAGGLSAADAIDLYNGSGGGTGFDLKPSGFASIQYLKVEGLSGFSAGEVDALSIVRPMTIGDTLSITPDNITNNTAKLFFQKPGAENQTLLALNFTSVAGVVQVTTARLDDPAALAALAGTSLIAVQATVAPILGTDPIAFQADVALSPSGNYNGDGHDLRVFAWDGTNWNSRAFVFTNNTAVLMGLTNLPPLVIAQFAAPPLALQAGTNGFAFQLAPIANCTQTLERSTNLVNWTSVMTFTPTNSMPMTLQDVHAPMDKAFYRMRLTVPQ